MGSRADYLNHTYLESCRLFSETRHHADTKGERMLDTHTEITEICLEAIKVHSFEMIAANILILYIREGQ